MAELTKREQREIARRERRAHEETLVRRKRTQQVVVRAFAALVVVAVLVGVGYFLVTTATVNVGEVVADQGQGHLPEGSNITYNPYPPASGPHYPRTLDPGFHDQPAAAGYWVHNLEHGYVVALYKCPQDCPELKDQLRRAYDTLPQSKFEKVKFLAVPDENIDSPLVLLAWNHQLKLQAYDQAQVLAFYNAYVDRGPENVP